MSTETQTPTAHDVADRYLRAWNADGPARTLEAAFAPDVRYVDPLADVHGHEALTAVIDAVRRQFPEFSFRLRGEPEAHHDVVRFGWGLGPGGGPAVVEGSDVVVLSADGRIGAVIGFLDRVPEAR